MFIATAVLFLIIFIHIISKKTIKNKLKAEYERNLLNGNKIKAKQIGRIYYNVITKESKKAKGVVNIDRKIIEDFKSFNVMNLV